MSLVPRRRTNYKGGPRPTNLAADPGHINTLYFLMVHAEAIRGNSYDEQGKLIEQLTDFHSEKTMALLIPDRDREQREDFVWCLPAARVSWNKWYELSKTFKLVTPEGVRYMNRMEGRKLKTILMLPTVEQTDEDVVTACAWLRMVKQINCRMYVCRCETTPQSMSDIILNSVGSDPQLMEEVDDGNPTNAQDTASEP